MSDKRVGIVTINDDTNYGNRLQNYALQEAVRALGWEPETVRNRTPSWDASLLVPRMMHELQRNLRRPRQAGNTHSGQACRRPAALTGPIRRTPACGDRGVHPCPPERLGVSLQRRARGLLGHALLASDHRVRSGVESGLPPRSGIGLPGLRGRVAAYVVCGEFRRPRSAEVPALTVRELVERYRTSLGSRGRRGQDRRRPHRASRTGGRRPDDVGRTGRAGID